VIHIAKLTETISFNVSKKDKQKLHKKATELGIPLARIVRNIVLKKYKNLAIGYLSPGVIPAKNDIGIRRLKPPKPGMKPKTKDELNFRECINQLKDLFNNGINILGKLEDFELGIKHESELDVLSQESKERMIRRQEKEKLLTT